VNTRIEVSSESGFVVLGDPQVPLPSGLDQEAQLRQMEPLARAARIFFLVTDDPVVYRLDLMADEPTPAGLEREFEPLGGAFRLDVPGGHLAVTGWDKAGTPCEAGGLPVTGGTHHLSVLTRRPVDGARHAADMAALLGPDWGYMQRIDRLGLVGCLPLAATSLCILAQRWRWLWYVLPLLAVSWVPFLVLKQGRRYRAAERRVSEAEKALPHFVIRLVPTAESDLPGGYIRV
jgi:hypothetical protein